MSVTLHNFFQVNKVQGVPIYSIVLHNGKPHFLFHFLIEQFFNYLIFYFSYTEITEKEEMDVSSVILLEEG